MVNIAIFSPSQNPYSETFIQAHKNKLSGNVFYFYGKGLGIALEGVGKLATSFRLNQLKFKRKLLGKPFSYISDRLILDALKKYNIDVILVEYGTRAYALKRVLKSAQLPVVVHFHGYDASVTEVVENSNNYKEVFQIATHIIAVSKKMEQMLLDLGCPKDKLVYNVYGPQVEFESVRPTFSKKQFIGIGRFTDKKAPYYTIMAFHKVVLRHPDAKLLLAGEGILMDVCINLVKYFKLENNVLFLGVISPDVYRTLLSESLGFVQHSIRSKRGDMEGTPLAVLEASVAGLPVISTFHAGIPDVIVHGKTGLLCEEHDVDMMAKHMLQLLDMPECAKEMGAYGKARILEHFSLGRHIEHLQSLMQGAVKD